MPHQNPLNSKHLAQLNKDLKDLELIMEDANLAEASGIPHMDKIKESCDLCRQKIELLKMNYFNKAK